MLRTRTDVWCWALLGSLGLLPGCGGQSAPNEAEAGGAGGGPSPGPAGGQGIGGGAVANGGSTFGGTWGGTASVPTGGAGAQPNGGAAPLPNGGSAGHPAQSACKGATPIVEGGVESGLWRCDDGVIHRPAPVKCENNLPRPAEPLPPHVSARECASDTDCTAEPYGYCEFAGQLLTGMCKYGCVTDADCDAGNLCVCGPEFGFCASATCQSDRDCGGDLQCAAWLPLIGYGCGERPAYACQSPRDTCKTDAECGQGNFCAVTSGVRACKPIVGAACGRPFLVQGQERCACAVTSAAWRGKLDSSPALAELSSSQRQRLGEEWTKMALMEHASVAAFARFALQLLHVGAPRELLQACQQAMADETEHARLCFELASVYLGRDVGPGVLPMDAALEGTTLQSIVRLVVREGCIGETIAAQEAAEAVACAQDAAVLRVLERIHHDERAHAELAWRFVAWALKQGGAGLHAVVADELALAASELQRGTEPQQNEQADERALAQHGILPAPTRAELRRAVLSDIVLPCGQELLAQATPGDVPARRANV